MKTPRVSLVVLCVMSLLWLWSLAGCGAKADVLTACSGSWKADKGAETVEIDLVGDSKRIVVGGNAYPVSVQRIDKGSNLAVVKVQKPDGSLAEWMLQQRWDDNGRDFDLIFSHDGRREVLTIKS